MFLTGLAGGAGGYDPLVLLLVALAIEAMVGEAKWLFRRVPHPRHLLTSAVAILERKLNRPHRSATDRAVRGALVALVMMTAAGAVGWGAAWFARRHPWAAAIELALLVMLVAQRAPFDGARAVRRALDEGAIKAAREAAARVSRQPATRLDAHGAARLAIEAVADRFATGVVAPAFWYALFGLPGLGVHAAAAVINRRLGKTRPEPLAFGFAAERLCDILEVIPARLAALLITAAAAFAPTASPARALRVMVRDGAKMGRMSAGWPAGAMAGALDLALAGPRLGGERRPWLGDGRATAGSRDIRRALFLYAVACVMNGLCIAVLVVLRLHPNG